MPYAVQTVGRGFRPHRLPAALTAFGVALGVAVMIVVVAFGRGLEADFDAMYGHLESEVLVSPMPSNGPGDRLTRGLNDADVAALRNRSAAPAIASVTPIVAGTVSIRPSGSDRKTIDARTVTLLGSTAAYRETIPTGLTSGSFFTPAQSDSGARVVVLGAQIAAALSGGDDAPSPVGRSIRIGRGEFTVVGVLGSDGDHDNSAVVPLPAARTQLFGTVAIGTAVNSIVVRAVDRDAVPEATAQLAAILHERHSIEDPFGSDFTVQALSPPTQNTRSWLGIFTFFLGAVGAVSLVVGGIGVTNLALVSLKERAREISIRRAMGSSRPGLFFQVLLETTGLTSAAGFVGAGAGVGLTKIIDLVAPIMFPGLPEPRLLPVTVLVAGGLSVVVGLAAGCYPALRAAAVPPIKPSFVDQPRSAATPVGGTG
jgi:putative ABC transport system permease protein